MKPKINRTSFGCITVEGTNIDHDIYIRLNGMVEKRKKKLSSEIYGTSHVISLPEAEYLYEQGATRVIIGTGQDGNLHLSDEAVAYLAKHQMPVELLLTPEAADRWNECPEAAIGLFHITC